MKYNTDINKNVKKYNTDLNRMKNDVQKIKNNEKDGIKGLLILVGILGVIALYVSWDYTPYKSNSNDYDDAVRYLQDSINSQK